MQGLSDPVTPRIISVPFPWVENRFPVCSVVQSVKMECCPQQSDRCPRILIQAFSKAAPWKLAHNRFTKDGEVQITAKGRQSSVLLELLSPGSLPFPPSSRECMNLGCEALKTSQHPLPPLVHTSKHVCLLRCTHTWLPSLLLTRTAVAAET